MELTPTAYVILGMLAWGPMSGYDIKAAVDKSVRFFWAASYGQIYPELRRLSEAGLVEGETEPQSGRRRTVFSLTEGGRAALERWLAHEPKAFETRDEALLKLFFTDAAPDTAVDALDAKRRFHEAKLRQLRAIEATARPEGSRALVLRYGIESSEWMIEWCTREVERLS
jgi:DNA-binding PadR family transcriptional regulator